MGFPRTRLRRLREHAVLREMVGRVDLAPADLVAPLFVKEGLSEPEPIPSLPPHAQHTLDSLIRAVGSLMESGVRAVILFGIPQHKDPTGSGAFAEEGIIQQALSRLSGEFSDDLLRIADLCLCEYTPHGHCGIVREGRVDNDLTLETYRRVAEAQAAAGADVIAPSGMMDGQVAAIRQALDGNGFTQVPILAYAAKYASSLYAPFRDAAESAPQFGDRRSYQLDPAAREEAFREVALDVEEGADIVMVKPALPNLDILQAVRARFDVPTAAYQVSGEYAMIKAAALAGWLDERRVALETLTAIKRAGADVILTYFAGEVEGWLRA
jgi:porphobilinogen synthase